MQVYIYAGLYICRFIYMQVYRAESGITVKLREALHLNPINRNVNLKRVE